jgi:outer membrane protein OmpA-like peptidoglycan-associated protein
MSRIPAGRSATLAAVLMMLATSVHAQRPGAVEIGVLGRYTIYDSTLTLSDRFGGGGRLGVFLIPNLELSGAVVYTPTETTAEDVSNTNIAARLVYNLPVAERLALLLGAGYVHTRYNATSADAADNGATGLLGLRYWISHAISVRGEGVLDYLPSPDNGADQNLNWGIQLGLSYVFGTVGDRDGDGVADTHDACADTPAGVAVDAAGCPVDADRDRVADYLDSCANTPRGAQVDAKGCVLDGDGDGVRDDLDRCPTTPPGEAVDAAGCPLDADRDGVPDARDRCANTPAGVGVTEDGCPRDSDGDGVMDGLDKCPGTVAGARVDAAGCPESVILHGVDFATGSARLTTPAQAILDGVAQMLLANPDVRVEVGGHTDSTGSAEVNTRLSQERAEAVVAYLVKKGVSADRLTAHGYGSDRPIADNATPEGRAQNRRVELVRVPR